MAKIEDYAALVAARKVCRACIGVTNPADIEGGQYDTDEIGPWSRWQGNLNAQLMVAGQDWGDTKYFRGWAGLEKQSNPTNATLVHLVRSLGIHIGPPGGTEGQDLVFFTNAVLCLKEGGLQGKVDRAWFRNCRGHLRRQIEIVHPKVVIGLGERAFESILSAFDLVAGPFHAEVENPEGTALPNGSRAFAVYHCGARVRNTHRSLEEQENDWARIRAVLAQIG